MQQWEENIERFVALTNIHDVRMLLVGGGAVNFHGYQRHSADVDFWIETTPLNFEKLILVFNEMGYELDDFPELVKQQLQNISVKFSPMELSLELITNFSVNKTFEQAYLDSEMVEIKLNPSISIRVLNLEDLITSKIKSNRHKDLLDVSKLREINS